MSKIEFIIYLFISVIFISCGEEEISISLKSEDPRLAVEGYVTTDYAPFYVVLTLSSDYFCNEACPAIKGATVNISDGTNIYRLYESQNGVYKTLTFQRGVIGNNYILSISDIDINQDGIKEEYTAESNLYAENQLDSTFLEYVEEGGSKYWKVLAWAKEDANAENYYVFKAYSNKCDLTPNISDMGLVEDKYINGNDIEGVDFIWLLDEDSDGKNSEYKPVVGDTLIVEMDGITESYYSFLTAIEEETASKSPIFSGPSANVPCNISNGALGFFTAYSISRDTIFVDQSIINQKDNY